MARAHFALPALLFVLSCAAAPSAPTLMSSAVGTTASPVATTAAPITIPPLSGPSRTFVFDHAGAFPVSAYTTASRIVLYDDGAFALQYTSLKLEYRGVYQESAGSSTFRWEGWSSAGAWEATGTVSDGLLTMHYNLIMQLTDFEDAVYRLTQ